MVASDEMKELRQQVEKLRERLDFMAPMLSLLTYTQDYFQRVECEASVQLMRLKNARLADSAAVEGSADKEKPDPNSVETARWLHTITDLMIGLGGQGTGAPNSARTPSMPATTPELVQRPSLLRVESLLSNVEEVAAGHEGEGHLREAQPRLSSSNRRSPPHFGAKGHPATRAELAAERPRVPYESSLRGGGGPSLSTTASGDSSARGPLGAALSPSPSESAPGRGALGHGQAHVPGTEALGLGRGQQGGGQAWQLAGSNLESTLEFGGLALGRGTWANAYRQATGMRREALRLLCTSGIVTERELADDLTVISEEHIDECVSIAVEMLQRWPQEHGPPPQQEAKRFFEERLAAMYMKRAPSPFGLT